MMAWQAVAKFRFGRLNQADRAIQRFERRLLSGHCFIELLV